MNISTSHSLRRRPPRGVRARARRWIGLVAVVAALPLVSTAQGTHRDARVTLDGAPMSLDQPPLVREGLVFVPLRAIFERLGARVAFDGGLIEASAAGRTIVLRVGESNASIDGEQHVLESPPIVVRGRVMVPLRFVSVALGATVDFDDASRTVSIVPAVIAPPTVPPTQAPISLRPIRLEPRSGATIERSRPEISGTFPETVDPNSVTLVLDGRDVTPDAYVSDRSFVYDPTFDLPAGAHAVAVTGKTPDREPFAERWEFASREAANASYVNGLEPPNGTFVGSTFTVSAFTKPRARIHVVATTSPTLATFTEAADSSSSANVTADRRGYFSVRLRMNVPSGLVDVLISSQARDGSVAVRTLRLRQ